jgi:hypothetical protein
MTSPLVTLPLTVHVLDTSIISVYALLAADTLCFASKADHAVEHENRCLQVYSRRTADGNPSGGSSIGVGSTSSLFRRTEIGSFTSQTSDSSSSVASGISGKDNNKAILAWGSGADKRWRELIQVTESEDQVDEEPFGKSLLSVPSGSSPKPQIMRIRRFEDVDPFCYSFLSITIQISLEFIGHSLCCKSKYAVQLIYLLHG